MRALTHPGRFRAWVLVRLRGLPPDQVGGSWARVWRAAAHIYRDRAINTMVGLRMAQEDTRTLQRALDEKDDRRPLAGGELDDYVAGLRERAQSLWMHAVDLTHERETLLTERAAARVVVQAARAALGAPLFEHRKPLEEALAAYDDAVKTRGT